MERIKITPEEGWEIDVENSTLGDIAFKKIEKGLPKTWEELEIVSGYYINSDSALDMCLNAEAIKHDRNIFATEKQAEACIALSQLSQLIQVYNDGWVADYTNGEWKYQIIFFNNAIDVACVTKMQSFLTFRTEEIRNKFLENFRELINTAEPLL